MSSLSRPFIRALLVLVICYPLMIVLTYQQGEKYGEQLLPLYQLTLKVVAPEFDITNLKIIEKKQQKLFSATFVNRESRMIGGQELKAQADITSTTLLGHALQHLILIATITLCWMAYRWKNWLYNLLMLLLTIPALLLTEVLDVPMVLFGAVQDLIYFYLSPDQLSRSPAVTWMHIMNGGGRLALAVGSILAAIFLCELIHSGSTHQNPTKHDKPSTN